jgi:hypothetical protein
MPRYFFHIHDDIELRDDEGLELPDAEAAHKQALAGVRDMMCDQMRKGRLSLRHWVEVEDESGNSVLKLTFGDAVTIER